MIEGMASRHEELTPGSDALRGQGGRYEFFEDAHGLLFGPRPPGAAVVDLIETRRGDLDNIQILFATACLQQVGREDDAVRLFATQTDCALEEAREFCVRGEPPTVAFGPPPWAVATADETMAAIRHDSMVARRRHVIYVVIGVVVMAAIVVGVRFLVRLVVWLTSG